MSETKICPYCGEEIKAEAKKCRYCGEWLGERQTTNNSAATTRKQELETPGKHSESISPKEVLRRVEEEWNRRLKKDYEEFDDKFFRNRAVIKTLCNTALVLIFFSFVKYVCVAINMSFNIDSDKPSLIWNILTACRLIPDWVTDFSGIIVAVVAFAFYQQLKYQYRPFNPKLHKEMVFWAKMFAVSYFVATCLGVILTELFEIEIENVYTLACACICLIGAVLSLVALILVGTKYKKEYDDDWLLSIARLFVIITCVIPIVGGIVSLFYPQGSVGYSVFICIGTVAGFFACYFLLNFFYCSLKEGDGELSFIDSMLIPIVCIFVVLSLALGFLPQKVQQKLETKAVEMEDVKELDDEGDEIDLSVFQDAPDNPVLVAETDDAAFFLNDESTEYGVSYGMKLYEYDKEKKDLSVSMDLALDIQDYASSSNSLFFITNSGTLKTLSRFDLSTHELGSIYGVTLGGAGEEGYEFTSDDMKFTSDRTKVSIKEEGKNHTYELEELVSELDYPLK